MASVILDHVTKRYRDVVAVSDMSIEIADGEFAVLVGPSGCGKTTVLRLIAGLEAPDDGEILIDGRVVNGLDPGARNVAMVFENYALYPHLAVRGNLDFPLRLRRTPAEEIRRRVSAVAASMEVGGLLERKPPGSRPAKPSTSPSGEPSCATSRPCSCSTMRSRTWTPASASRPGPSLPDSTGNRGRRSSP